MDALTETVSIMKVDIGQLQGSVYAPFVRASVRRRARTPVVPGERHPGQDTLDGSKEKPLSE
ncbi:MAG: hypothetical protein LBT40_18580 [Deltaproteobacteria bacterium]|nr:hypothetical protein [Deltaproteobacteria bacterium]